MTIDAHARYRAVGAHGMRRKAARSLARAVALCLVCFSPSTLHAATDDAGAPRLVPPALVAPVEPTYPAEERARGAPASVILALDVDRAGHVTHAEVTESGGAAFDASALDAASRLAFEPATRDGAKVAAKIAFRFDFRIEAPPTPPPVASPPVPSSPPAPPAPTPPVTPAKVADDDVVDIDVRGDRPPREVTRRVIEASEIARLPGTNGDALHAVENLPGVGRTSGVTGDLVVRGSAPEDTGVFVDGTWIPNAFHLGGLSSVVPTDVLERLDFYPGNFSPQYGRQMGGIIDVGIRSPRKDRFGGLAQIDLLDGRVLVEGPLSRSTRVLVAGRRSWIDAWLGPVLRSGGVGVSTAPVYYDYQAILEHDFSSSTTGRVVFFGSDDRLALTVPPGSGDPEGGTLGSGDAFFRVQTRLDTRLSEQVRWTQMASIGTTTQHFTFGNDFLDAHYLITDVRSDLRAKLGRAVTVMGGLDLLAGSFDVDLRFPAVAPSGQVAGPSFGTPKNALHGSGVLTRPGAYAMLELSPLDNVKVMPGARVDYSSEIEQWTVDPRLTVRADVHHDFPRTTLKGGAGVFHQPPQPGQSLSPFGSNTVRNNEAIHYSAGVEQEISRDVTVSTEAFYKDLRDLVTAEPSTTASGNTYDNQGSGRAFGTEFLLRWKPGGRFFGWVAYTLSRSERRDHPAEPLYTYQFDQTHIFNALASYSLGRGWTLGARWRYVSGNPYTPYRGGVEDYDAGAYAAITSPNANSARIGAFHSLDLRVDKTWAFASWKLTAYLDLRNAYNRENPEAATYNYNYSRSSAVNGLPILPLLGLRGEL